MRKYLTILIFLLPLFGMAQTPTSNAGADQTIYLTSTNSVTLTGTATNRSTSTWSEISTDYSSGATITSPSSLTTTVTGLPQGVFYFELAVTSPTDVVATDTVVVRVDYDVAPATSTLLRGITPVLSQMVPVVNDRTDTTNFIAGQESHCNFPDNPTGEVFYDRARSNGLFIDSQLGKFYSILEDGYQWNNSGYDRSEMSFGSFYTLDTNHIYTFEWKGYFPQLLVVSQEIIVIWQLHGNDGNSPPFALRPSGGNLIFDDLDSAGRGTLCSLSALVKSVHTIRIYIKEGMNGFVKVDYDGVEKYIRKSGKVGRFSDYPKFATLYDWSNTIVDVNNHTRNKKFPLVTEDFNLYTVTDTTTTSNIAPTIYAGDNQTITLPTNSVTLTATYTLASGHTGTFQWVKESGGSATITSPTSSTTTVTGLGAGSYRFGCTLTQDDSQTAYDYVLVTVNNSGIINYHVDKIVFKGGKKVFRNAN